MPNRIIKESIKFSEQIDELTWFEECVFYRLMVSADDYGCMDGRTIVLRNALFPTKDTVTKKAIEDAIDHLVSVGLLYRYCDTASGMPYLFFPTWEKHQRVRNKHRKYPIPPCLSGQESAEDASFDSGSPSNDSQMSAGCLSESESNPNPNPNPNPKESTARARTSVDDGNLAAGFDRFWSAYPRHTDKERARKAFIKLAPNDELLQTILDAIAKQRASRQWSDPQYIPHPSTWLNQKRWEDEPVQGAQSAVDRLYQDIQEGKYREP